MFIMCLRTRARAAWMASLRHWAERTVGALEAVGRPTWGPVGAEVINVFTRALMAFMWPVMVAGMGAVVVGGLGTLPPTAGAGSVITLPSRSATANEVLAPYTKRMKSAAGISYTMQSVSQRTFL